MASLITDINNGNIAGIYLFYGEENFKKRYYKDALIKAVVKGNMMNYSAYEGKDINWQAVFDMSQTMPFFSDRRLIVIENSGKFKQAGKGEDALNEKSVKIPSDKNKSDLLEKIIDMLPDTTCIAFFEEGAAKNKKVFKKAASKGIAFECTRDTEDAVINWLAKGFARSGKKVRKSTLQLMISRIGTEYDSLRPEVEKVISYAGNKEIIDDSDILDITSENIESRIFDMLASICNKDVKTVMDKYQDLLANREPPLYIMAMIRNQFRTMLEVKELSEKNMNSAEIAKVTGRPQFAVNKFFRYLRYFDKEQIENILDEISETDRKIKTGEIKDQTGVEMLLIEFSG